MVQRRRAARRSRAAARRARRGSRRRRARREPRRLELGERRHQRLGDVLAAVGAEAVLDAPVVAIARGSAAAARRGRCDGGRRTPRSFSGSLTPGAASVPLTRRRRRTGAPRRSPRRRCPASARRRGSAAPSRGARGDELPVERLARAAAQRPARAASSRWKSVWKRSSALEVGAAAHARGLDHLAPVRRATSAQNAGPSSPCSWTCVSPTPSAARGDLVERRVDEHADELGLRGAAPRAIRAPRRAARSARGEPRPEDQPERPGAELDGAARRPRGA